VTGAPRLETAVAAVERGATHYLTKPVDIERLRNVVRKCMQARHFARARRQLVGLGDDASRQIGDLAGLGARFENALATSFMYCQPIVRWSDQSTFAYEALIRLSESTIPHPGALFDAAERLGRTIDVGRRVRAFCGQLLGLSQDALLFVNLHTDDLTDELLYRSEEPLTVVAPRVVLEVTERARLESVTDVRNRVTRLRALGFRIAIDDLGAGYAGLTSFAALEPEFMKLDRALVEGIDESKTKRKLVAAMLRACDDLGVQVIGEGVETLAERDILVDMGCDLLQGYLFARPAAPFVTPSF
jgi:EAL domain-containing protein (putative c-di-GMP-specific phosphodiesterase class I)